MLASRVVPGGRARGGHRGGLGLRGRQGLELVAQSAAVQSATAREHGRAAGGDGGLRVLRTDQGLSPAIRDASADEGGNVYVAAEDAVYARAPADRDFKKFTPAAAGLTQNCHDPQYISNASPPDPAVTCPIISVAGAAAGKAVIGFKGVGIDYDYDATWALDSGGADLLSFDGNALTRDRHVFLASPPGVICEQWVPNTNNTVCATTWTDSTWMSGRKKMRQVKHILFPDYATTPHPSWNGFWSAMTPLMAGNPRATPTTHRSATTCPACPSATAEHCGSRPAIMVSAT